GGGGGGVGVGVGGGSGGGGGGWGGGGGHASLQCQRRRGSGVNLADDPQPGRAVVSSLVLCGGHECKAGGQQVGQLDAGGRVGAAVGHHDREADNVPHVGIGVAHCLADGQVRLLRRLRCAGVGVGSVRVLLVALAERRRVGRGLGANHPGRQRGRLRGGRVDVADVPNAGRRTIGPAGCVERQQREAPGEQVLNGHVARGVFAVVG